MTNLQIAIEKAVAALEPHVREVTIKRKIRGKEKTIVVDRIVSLPSFVGPFQRKTIELLVDAAAKYEALQRRQRECAYAVPCQQCIHQACGSHKVKKAKQDNAPVDEAALGPMFEEVSDD